MSEATHIEISHDPEPIRLFESDFLEFFTHIHPVVVLIIWVPVATYFLITGILNSPGGTAVHVPIGFLLGMLLWTFAEYTLHRYVFHYQPRNPWQEKIVFLFHGIHHLQPQCKTRLVMPPAVSVPMIGPTFSGFITGYLIYDMTHYATHHLPMRHGIWKFLKRHHMQHHYRTPDRRFGVSSPLWDLVFGTEPAK